MTALSQKRIKTYNPFDKTRGVNQENAFYTVKILRCKRLLWNLLWCLHLLEMLVSVT